MSFTADIGDDYAEVSEAVANRSTGTGEYPPLPRGRYQAVVEENLGIELVTERTDNANYGKRVVRLKTRIPQGSPTGAGRVFFVDVPLFTRWAPTPKNPTGAEAWMFTNFFEKVMGVPREDIAAKKPLPSNVEGRPLTIILDKPELPDAKNPLGRSRVSDVDAPDADFSRTPVLGANQSAAPWLTPDNRLIPDHPSLQPKTPGAAGAGIPTIGGGSVPAGIPAVGGGIPAAPGGIPTIGGPAPAAAPAAQTWVQPGVVPPAAVAPAVSQQPIGVPQWGTTPATNPELAAAAQPVGY